MEDVGTRMDLLLDSGWCSGVPSEISLHEPLGYLVPYLVRYEYLAVLAQHQACATEHGKAGKSA